MGGKHGLIRLCLALCLWSGGVLARDAAFVEPGTLSSKGGTAEGLIADPKTFDAGESSVGVARRVSMFFVNTGGAPITISEVTTTGDGNVAVQHEDSDCKANGKLAAFSRCSISLSVTAISSGAWSVEVLAMHDGPGRIARAVVSGRAAADAKSVTRGEGLNLSSRDMKPIDFGDVDTAGAAAVRTALMVNDSPDILTIKAIDLIAVDSGLELLTTGCAVDQELKPDSSCPLTLKWHPTGKGSIATDLIMRHSGKVGFTVIPVRGRAIGDDRSLLAGTMNNESMAGNGKKTAVPSPLSAQDVEMVTGKLPATVSEPVAPTRASAKSESDSKLYLIGMVGRRAILQRDGITKTLAVGEEIELAGATVQLLALAEREARVSLNGQSRMLKLGSSGYHPVAPNKTKTDGMAASSAISIGTQSSSGK